MHGTNPQGPVGDSPDEHEAIAVVGMSLRVPGGEDLDDFWTRLTEGVESVTRFGEDELRAAGIPDSELNDPHYIRAKPVLDSVAEFDAPFFGLTPREAQVRDPQHRLFLESAYTALEHAGYDPFRFPGAVGVYGGGAPNFYREWNVSSHPEASAYLGEVGVMVANATDYITTAVSHHLGLTGPSVNVVTACSTSLVAVHLACQALRTGECDAAVAGGVQVELPRVTGYHSAEGGMFSVTGRVRPFDAAADGTIFGTGVGTVVLKRHADAVAAGDHIHAVIRASAINNDGAQKAGFTAPSVAGQATLIRQAMTSFGLDPAHIGYVEAHGTGTRVGDPIEVNALTRAYRDLGLTGVGICPIGSVKGNVGHLGPAAGIIGLIKTVLALKTGSIPPSINYTEPNPEIDFENGPFYVNTELSPWPEHQPTRMAAVSSFGVGGTNAHVVVAEPPPAPRRTPEPGNAGRPLVLPLSARTPEALSGIATALADHLEAHPGQRPEDVAATLACGRPRLRHRAALVPGDQPLPEALRAARTGGSLPGAAGPATGPVASRPVAFLFPGQGSQHLGMGKRLYDQEPVFREAVDRCADLARPHLEADLREVMFAAERPAAVRALTRTSMAQPALFTMEFAMAGLLTSWGLEPKAMVGHSVGEYVAACLAGVFSLEDAVRLVVRRGALVQALPGGSMMAVPAAAEEVEGLPGIDIAAYNGARLTVVSGPDKAVEAARAALAVRGIDGHRLHTSHAFHSAMMEPALDAFAAELAGVELHAPTVPFVSNVTGEWITGAQATDPAYWTGHLRAPVRYAPSVELLLEDEELLLVEAGPGQVLTGLTRGHAVATGRRGRTVVPTMPMPQGKEEGPHCLARAVATLWTEGAPLDWAAYWGEDWQRLPLPTYPFQRKVHWLDPVAPSASRTEPAEPAETAAVREEGRRPIERALFRPEWREDLNPAPGTASLARAWLVLRRGTALDGVVNRLRQAGGQVVTVEPGAQYARLTGSRYVVRPGEREDHTRLVASLAADGLLPERVLHGWLFGPPEGEETTGEWLDLGFFSVLFLAQSLAERSSALAPDLRWDVVGSRTRAVTGAETVEPARAAVTGVCDVMAKELPEMAVRCLDATEHRFTEGLLEELARAGGPAPSFAASGDRWVAMRGRRRWLLGYAQVPEPRATDPSGPLRERGTYLVTGGLGGIGLTVAEGLAKAVRARLVLTARSAFPPREEWDRLLAAGPSGDGDSGDSGEGAEGASAAVLENIRWLRRIESYGAEVLVCRADVADEEAMRAVVTRGEREFGPFHGVFHTAGVPGGGLLALKTRAEAERVMAAKVTGTLVLDRLLGDQVEVMVLFSSITSVAGNLGQTDYAAANAFLDAYAHARDAEGPGFTVSVNWDAWAEIGMAAKADALAPAAFRALQTGAQARIGTLVTAPVAPVRPEEGAGGGNGNGNGHRMSNGHQAAEAAEAAKGVLAAANGAHQSGTAGGHHASPQLPPGTHPLLGERSEGPEGRIRYRLRVDGAAHWVTREHRVAGTPVWPATAYLETARAAGDDALAANGAPLRLTDVTFLSVLTLAEPRVLCTTLAPERGGYRFSVASSADEEEWTEHATGLVRTAPGGAPQVQDLELLRELFPVVKAETDPFEPEQGLIEFGPRWANMAEIRRDDSSTLARIELPGRYAEELADYPLHPAVLDAATSNAVYLPELGPTGESYLPFSISEITQRAPLPATVHVYSRRRGAHQNMITFDITLTDDAGREVVDVTGYTVRVWDPAEFRQSVTALAGSAAREPEAPREPEARSEGAADGAEAGAPASGLGGAFAIRPEEGMRALWHILGERVGPQVVVVPEGIHARLRTVESLTQDVIAQAGTPGTPSADSRSPHGPSSSGGASPAPSAAGARPGDGSATPHQRLTRLWAEALGVEAAEVDVDDDFFALGGNSLVGVQLAARVRKEFDTDLPIATLIENPTVRAIAGIITA